MQPLRSLLFLTTFVTLFALDSAARSQGLATQPVRSATGREYLRTFGSAAASTLAPQSGQISGLVALPFGGKAEDLGLLPVAPGIGRIQGSAARIDAWSTAHPDLRLELPPPLHVLNDRANQWVMAPTARLSRGVDGTNVMVGVIDSGLDVAHPEMRDANGKTRVAWMLDYSIQPVGLHPDLEAKYGSKDDRGKVVLGAVFSSDDIQSRLAAFAANEASCDESLGNRCLPIDELGHGTHVTGTAAGSGVGSTYGGMAPKANLVIVRGIRSGGGGIDNAFLTSGIQFLFERADDAKQPMVVNISLGSDFGPHDGTTLWEQTLATFIGPDKPGHAIVAAAGNSGSIAETPIHQNVRVTPGATTRVPVNTNGATTGSVEVWLTLHDGADLKVGLAGPDGEWVAPVDEGKQGGKNTSAYNAGVIYGAGLDNSPIPKGSRGAVVVWQGTWPTGTYNIELDGSGVVDMWVQGFGAADSGGATPALFAHGVREGTINLPATHPSVIGVGCTVNRTRWTSIAGADIALKIANLDAENGLPLSKAITLQPGSTPQYRELQDGEVCWFSSSGPTATGIQKPEIAAPGALVVSAMSRSAVPGTPGSIFTNPACPVLKSGATDNRCFQVDDHHALASGTSMSTPVVAGVVALLLQADPTLTQDKILGLLQAGAHRFRTSTIADDDAGPGEVDAMGSLDALDQMRTPTAFLPARATSWITLSSDYVPADGSSAMTAIVELRTADGQHRGDLFDASRLRPVVRVDGVEIATEPVITRRSPGVWYFAYTPPAGLGGSLATFGATFDGAAIVATKSLPIGPDRWTAKYPSAAAGSSCAFEAPTRGGGAGGSLGLAGLAAVVVLVRRRRHSSASVTTQPCGSQTASSGSNA